MGLFDRIEVQLLAALAVATACKLVQLYFIRRSSKNRVTQFQLAGKIKELFVHPVKSCACISVKEAECYSLGLSHGGVLDRSWMVITESGEFVSLRQHAKMALISVEIKEDEAIELSAPGMKPLRLDKKPKIEKNRVRRCSIFGVHGDGLDCGDEAAAWICKYLEKDNLRIVFSAPSLMKRQCSQHDKSWDDKTTPDDLTVFQDTMPFMMINDKSLDALNDNLEKAVTIRNFRPNMFIECNKPWDEDNWKEIRIGDTVSFRCLDPCTRCTLPTVDPHTGSRDKNLEPLKTLRRMRSYEPFGNSPLFGMNAAVTVTGTIRVGDPVYVTYKDEHEKDF